MPPMNFRVPLILTVIAASVAAQSAESRESQRAPFAEKYLRLGTALETEGRLDEARMNLQFVLERAPRHIPGLVALARVEQKLGLADPAAFHARTAIGVFDALLDPLPEEKALRVEAAGIVAAVDPHAKENENPVGRLPTMLLEQAKSYRKRGMHLSALRVLEHLKAIRGSTPEVEQIVADIRRNGGDEVAVEDALGGEDPLKGVSAAWIERADAEHRQWENAWVKETEHYTIRTNAGYEVMETVAIVIEPLHRFYRTFYGIDPKKAVPKVEVKVYATHDEFVSVAPPDLKTSGGYFGGKEIVTYDPRPTGGSIGSMIETLAHEASHQFTSIISRGWQPPWMNEGTASYFEGTTLLSNRNVRMNLVPRYSYRLETFLAHRATPGRFSLQTLLTTQGGLANYTGTHYAYGWALIYFLWNFEDDAGQNPYRPALTAMMTQGWKQPQDGAAHVEDFNKQVVQAAKVAGVTDLATFESAWQAFIEDVDAVQSGRLDPSDRDLARARAIATGKNKKTALRIYDRVAARRPDDLDVLYESGALALDLNLRSISADRFGRFVERTDGVLDPKDKRLQRALNDLSKVDPEFGQRRKAENEAVDRYLALAATYESEKFGMCALQCLERAKGLGRRPTELARRAAEIRAKTGATLRTWRLLFNERDVRDWTWANADDNTWKVEGEDLVSDYAPSTTGPNESNKIDYRMLHARTPAKAGYTFSAQMSPDASGCKLLGVCFGVRGEEDFRAIIVLPKSGSVDLSSHQNGAWSILGRKPWSEKELATWFRIEITVDGDVLDATLNGKPLFKQAIPGIGSGGNFGLLMGGGKARFRRMRVFEPD